MSYFSVESGRAGKSDVTRVPSRTGNDASSSANMATAYTVAMAMQYGFQTHACGDRMDLCCIVLGTQIINAHLCIV